MAYKFTHDKHLIKTNDADSMPELQPHCNPAVDRMRNLHFLAVYRYQEFFHAHQIYGLFINI